MTFPPGKWSPLLIGDQWPDDQDLIILLNGKNNRAVNKIRFINFSAMLNNAKRGLLAGQHGHTIDDLKEAFQAGQKHAYRMAEKNEVKESAYGTAYDSMLSLRHDLTALAEEGNHAIEKIQISKSTMETKVTQIAAAIHHYRAIANIAAAKYGDNVADAMQRIIEQNETQDQSARQFAASHGADFSQIFRRTGDEDELRERVRGTLSKGDSQQVLSAGQLPAVVPPADSGTPSPEAVPCEPNIFRDGHLPTVIQPPTRGAMTPSPATMSAQAALGGQLPPSSANRGASGGSTLPAPTTSSMTGAGTATSTAFPMPTPPPSASCGSNSPSVPPASSPAPSPIASAPAATPADLVQSFNRGMESTTPYSATADAVAPSRTEPHVTPTAPPAAAEVQTHVPAFDSPPPVQHAPVPEAPSPPIVAASLAPNPTQPIPSAAGPLPTYGADLRPAVPTTTPAAPPPSPPPLPATPSSAPVHPAAGQASTNHPPVVRQAPPPTSSTPPSNVGAQAVVATASGAVAGTASADATERARLRKIVITVARQQPRLAWAAGNRADNTTVLATDLASGWIPPGIALPTAVTLLQPARRSGNLEALLGEVNIAEAYTPIHHVPDEDEPLATSPRPRQAETIDEFAWELSQATQWRDGLPRLAHTLAKAACAGTGVLDSEIAILREHLATTSAKVLDSYPGNVDAHDVGNWQLLAAIDALAAGDKTSANYHFAWFQACAR